jgi:hypothetical protein
MLTGTYGKLMIDTIYYSKDGNEYPVCIESWTFSQDHEGCYVENVVITGEYAYLAYCDDVFMLDVIRLIEAFYKLCFSFHSGH